MNELLNYGEIIAIGTAVMVKYRSAFLWFLFLYVCLFTYTEIQLAELFKPELSYNGHTNYNFMLALLISLSLPAFAMFKSLYAKILLGALAIQAITLFGMTISGMEAYNIAIPDSDIFNYFAQFVSVNILMFETIIAWIVATHRKG